MACMCGDLYCGSCGPAQGNHKCSGCGVWSMDGPCADPAKCAAIVEAENKSYEEVYRQMEEDEKAAQEYWEMERATEVWYPCGCKASAGSPKYCPEHPTPPPEPREPEAREGVVAKTSGQLVTGILNEWIRCFISSPSAEQIRWAIDQTEAYSAELRAQNAALRLNTKCQTEALGESLVEATKRAETAELKLVAANLALAAAEKELTKLYSGEIDHDFANMVGELRRNLEAAERSLLQARKDVAHWKANHDDQKRRKQNVSRKLSELIKKNRAKKASTSAPESSL